MTLALVTSVAGGVTELDWEVADNSDSRSLCSLAFKNEMFIYGQVLTNKFCCVFQQPDIKTESKISL